MRVNILLNSIDKVKKFISIIEKQGDEFDIIAGRYIVDAKSIMGVLSIDLSKPVILASYTADIDKVRVLLRDFIEG